MANAVMGEVTVEVAGQPRTLTFTFETFEEIGQALGLTDFHDVIQRVHDDLSGKIVFRTLWAMLVAALREGWPEVTASDVRRALRPKDLPRVSEALVRALNEALPKPEAGAEEAQSPPAPAAQAA